MRVLQILVLLVSVAVGVWASRFHEQIRQEIHGLNEDRNTIGPLDQAFGRDVPEFDMSSPIVLPAADSPRVDYEPSEVQANPFLD